MSRPLRLRLSREKGFNLQALSLATNGLLAVNVARPGPWGNPFVVGEHGTRRECVELFEHMASGRIALGFGKDCACAQIAYRNHAADHLAALESHNLACSCPLPAEGEPDLCHGAVLIAWATDQRPVPSDTAGAAA